mmetsp:Transcript_2998/g.7773  ORF Transcript_2998/g.7773 Transcript_2998/m.7773 type:complete len:325 (-) Transcript_2998:691-1665(-)
MQSCLTHAECGLRHDVRHHARCRQRVETSRKFALDVEALTLEVVPHPPAQMSDIVVVDQEGCHLPELYLRNYHSQREDVECGPSVEEVAESQHFALGAKPQRHHPQDDQHNHEHHRYHQGEGEEDHLDHARARVHHFLIGNGHAQAHEAISSCLRHGVQNERGQHTGSGHREGIGKRTSDNDAGCQDQTRSQDPSVASRGVVRQRLHLAEAIPIGAVVLDAVAVLVADIPRSRVLVELRGDVAHDKGEDTCKGEREEGHHGDRLDHHRYVGVAAMPLDLVRLKCKNRQPRVDQAVLAVFIKEAKKFVPSPHGQHIWWCNPSDCH